MTTKRPGLHDEQIDTLVAEKLLDDVINWLVQGGEKDPDRAEVQGQLEEAMDIEDDGYRIARNLDSSGWEVDAELVRILDNGGSHRYRIHRDLVAKWVEENGIKPTFKVGDQVTFKDRGQHHTGEISKIDEKAGSYVVFCAAMGHVRTGNGSYGVILDYEKVHLAAEVAPASP